MKEIEEFAPEKKIELKRNGCSMRKIEKKNSQHHIKPFQAEKANLNQGDARFKGRTLSDYRFQKQGNIEQIKNSLKNKCDRKNPKVIKTSSLIMYIDRLKLKHTILPFLSEYFSPVDKSMQNLLKESVKLADFPSSLSSKPFYQNSVFSARIIKLKDNFILSIRNQKSSKIELNYSRKMQEQCGD